MELLDSYALLDDLVKRHDDFEEFETLLKELLQE